jgi:hypothetical protein
MLAPLDSPPSSAAVRYHRCPAATTGTGIVNWSNAMGTKGEGRAPKGPDSTMVCLSRASERDWVDQSLYQRVIVPIDAAVVRWFGGGGGGSVAVLAVILVK